MPWSDVWRGSGRSMDTNRCHRASRCTLEAPRTEIAVPDELQERGMQGLHGRVWQVGDLPANHRASGCHLEARRKVIALSDELQEHEEREQSEERVDPPLLPQSTRVQECRADYDLKANSKPI